MVHLMESFVLVGFATRPLAAEMTIDAVCRYGVPALAVLC